MKRTFAIAIAAACLASLLSAVDALSPGGASLAGLDALYPDLRNLYVDLHQNPELSFHEEKTAARLAERLRALGFEVTTGIAGTGVVGLLKNGAGPTVMIRTDLDALPVEEKTGLSYASKITTKDNSGATVPVTERTRSPSTTATRATRPWRRTLPSCTYSR